MCLVGAEVCLELKIVRGLQSFLFSSVLDQFFLKLVFVHSFFDVHLVRVFEVLFLNYSVMYSVLRWNSISVGCFLK